MGTLDYAFSHALRVGSRSFPQPDARPEVPWGAHAVKLPASALPSGPSPKQMQDPIFVPQVVMMVIVVMMVVRVRMIGGDIHTDDVSDGDMLLLLMTAEELRTGGGQQADSGPGPKGKRAGESSGWLQRAQEVGWLALVGGCHG